MISYNIVFQTITMLIDQEIKFTKATTPYLLTNRITKAQNRINLNQRSAGNLLR